MVKRLFLLVVLLAAAGGCGYKIWTSFQVDPPMVRAAQMLASNNVFGAQVVLRKVIKTNPRDVEAHVALIQTLLATADWLSVEREAKTLRALGIERTTVSPMLVQAYVGQKRFKDILAEVPAVALRPEEQAMNLALRSAGFIGLNDLVQAQAALDAAAELRPNDFWVRLQKARLALVRRDGPGALQEADAALALRPTSTEALWARSEALSLAWDNDGALAELDKAVAIAPLSPELRIARVGLLLRAGLDRRALDDVRLVFGLRPSNTTAVFYNALITMRAGRLADAGVEFDRLGSAMDQFPKAYLYKAQIALQAGNKDSALEDLGRFLKLQPGDSGGVRLLAQVELDSARPERALALLTPLTETKRPDAETVDLEGRSLFMLGHMPEAVQSFRRATELAPANKEYASHLAAAQTRFGIAPTQDDVLDQ